MLVRNKLSDNRLFLAGILLVMLDKRASLDRVIARKAMERYGPAVFQTVITRRSRIKEFSLSGIQERTVDDRLALRSFKNFLDELHIRIKP